MYDAEYYYFENDIYDIINIHKLNMQLNLTNVTNFLSNPSITQDGMVIRVHSSPLIIHLVQGRSQFVHNSFLADHILSLPEDCKLDCHLQKSPSSACPLQIHKVINIRSSYMLFGYHFVL